jgi:hypothetical protein
LARILPIFDLSCEENAARRWWNWPLVDAQAELLKLQKSGQIPDQPVKIEGAQIHYVASQTY